MRANALRLLVLWLAVSTGAHAGDAAALIRDGQARLDAGDFDAGLALFRQAAEADPDSSLAYTRIGGALLIKQDNKGAIDAFRSAIAKDPEKADAFVGMALAYLHGGDYALARAALAEAKRIDPAKAPKLDRLIAWIDARDATALGAD
jgi:tetratricopeptide (TPR) repeat protein